MEVRLRCRLPPSDVVKGDDRVNQVIDATVLEQLLGGLPRPVGEDVDRDASPGDGFERRPTVVVERQRRERTEHLVDQLVGDRHAMVGEDGPHGSLGNRLERRVAAGGCQGEGVAQQPSEPDVQRGSRPAEWCNSTPALALDVNSVAQPVTARGTSSTTASMTGSVVTFAMDSSDR
jgi:hypothetical protein